MLPARDDEFGSAVVSYRPAAGEEASALFADVPLAGLLTAAPWRTFVWYRRQKHNSGSYWSATEHDDINITGADIRSAVVVFGDPSVYLGELVFQILALLVTAATTSVCDVASNDTEIVMCHQDSTSG